MSYLSDMLDKMPNFLNPEQELKLIEFITQASLNQMATDRDSFVRALDLIADSQTFGGNWSVINSKNSEPINRLLRTLKAPEVSEALNLDTSKYINDFTF